MDGSYDVITPYRLEAPARGTSFEELVYRQDLNEVYLLLDFISGRPDKRLSDLDNKISDPESDDKHRMSSAEIIARVSEMRYPPDPPARERATDAAFLLELKDCLNWMAYPARGLTIAYTTMFAEGGHVSANAIWNAVLGILGRRPSGSTGAAAEPSRVQMAQLAFPGLVAIAAHFRLMKYFISLAGLVLSVVSAVWLWQATYGVRLAAQFAQAKLGENEMIARLYDELEKEGVATAVANQPGDLDTFCVTPPPSTQLASAADSVGQAVITKGMNSATRQLCNDYAYRHSLLLVAINDLGKYSLSPVFKVSSWFLPIHDVCAISDCGNLVPPDTSEQGSGRKALSRQEDAPSVAAMLAMMTTYLLPMLFGVVGTIAALLRGIQHRVNESTLAPRDLALSLFRLSLGMVAGICVGLFFSPPSNLPQTGGAIGVLTLSASGIAFLAGYGAEGFFRALDALVAHLFNLDKAEAQRTLR